MHLSYVFPDCIAFGSGGGPKFNTAVYEADNGDRSVYIPWPIGRHEYDASSGVKTIGDFESVLALYHVAQGRAHTFDFKDWSDFKSTTSTGTISDLDQDLGTGDASETDFPLYKAYTVGSVTRYRAIQRPDISTLIVSGNGSPITTGWSWIESEFLIRFDTPPAGGVVLKCGYQFHVPVAFASNVFSNRFVNRNAADGLLVQYPIELEEVKLKAADFA